MQPSKVILPQITSSSLNLLFFCEAIIYTFTTTTTTTAAAAAEISALLLCQKP
jgi:hypothetical protein